VLNKSQRLRGQLAIYSGDKVNCFNAPESR